MTLLGIRMSGALPTGNRQHSSFSHRTNERGHFIALASCMHAIWNFLCSNVAVSTLTYKDACNHFQIACACMHGNAGVEVCMHICMRAIQNFLHFKKLKFRACMQSWNFPCYEEATYVAISSLLFERVRFHMHEHSQFLRHFVRARFPKPP